MITKSLNNAKANDNNSSQKKGVKPAFFQPKLTINQPNDIYEQEADHMADKVMRMPDLSANQNAFFKPAHNHIQRKCQACEEKEKHVHRKESNGNEVHGSNGLDNYVSSLSSSGQAMSPASRSFFEPRFGHDFSNVKIHTDAVAAKSAQSINALAYTTGNNIVFNSGQYAPESDSGKRLMAHELTHVVQQRGAIQTKIIQRDGNKGSQVPPQGGQAQTQPADPCGNPPALASVTKVDPNTKASTTISLTSDTFDKLNSGPGGIDFSNCGMPLSTNTQGKLLFKAASGQPGWQYTARLQDCTVPPPNANAPTPWRLGFIQTVESSLYSAKYTKNKFSQITSAGRDALNFNQRSNNVPAPWYDKPDGPFGSQLYPTVPQINDTPFVTFPITHPADSTAFLQSVCMKGKFNIWLIVHNKNTAPTQSNVDFLYFWAINMNLNFFLNNTEAQQHPCSTQPWFKTGMIAMTNKGAGRGTNTLIWDQPVAGVSQVKNDNLTSDPCTGGGGT